MKEGARAVGTAAESSEDGAGSSGEQQQNDADEEDEVDSSLEQEDEEEQDDEEQEEEEEEEGGGEAAAAVPVRRATPTAVPVNDVSEGLTGMYLSAPLVSPTYPTLPLPISFSVSVSVSVSVPRRQCFCGTCPSTAAPPPCPPPWGPSGRSLRRPCWCPTRALHSPSSGTGAPWRSVSPLLGPGQACPSTGAAAGWIWLWTGQSVGATGKALPPRD